MPGMGAPPPPVKIPLYEPSKPKLEKKQVKPFGWKRVIIDRKGLDNKPPITYNVVDNSMKKLDPKWAGINVIWKDIEESKSFTHEMIIDMFPAKAPTMAKVVATVVKSTKKSFFGSDKVQNLSIMISRMPDADSIINAVETMKLLSFNCEKIVMLLKQWPSDEIDELIEQAAEDGDNLAEWERPEQLFIRLGRQRKFENRLKLCRFYLEFDPKVKNILS